MADARLERLRSLTHLREMLRRLILEESALRDVDAEKAAHLQDAVNDLRTMIARLEEPGSRDTPSDCKPCDPPDVKATGQRVADAPRKRNGTTHGLAEYV